MLRKGRFDEVFFLDLPTREERKQVFKVHLEKRKCSMISQKFNLEKLADSSKGYVGAEIEAVVKDAMFSAFMDGERELKTEDLLNSIDDMVPMAKSHAQVIEELRKCGKEVLAKNASLPETEGEVGMDAINCARKPLRQIAG